MSLKQTIETALNEAIANIQVPLIVSVGEALYRQSQKNSILRPFVRTVVKYASQDIHNIVNDPNIWAVMLGSPDFLRHIVKYAATRQNALPGGPDFGEGSDDWLFEGTGVLENLVALV